MSNFGRLTMIGAGNMGGAILSGLVSAGADPALLTAVEAFPVRRDQLAADLGINVTDNAAEAVADADVIMVAVKPKQVADALAGLPVRDGVLVVSIAAGVSTEVLEGLLPTARVVRVMPNTAALVGQGLAGISGGASARPEDVEVAVELLSSVGTAVVVPESQQDLITATSGSGIAYLFMVAESMIEAAVTLGLTRAQAGDIVRQTFVGASELLATGEHPVILREQVTSPGGTTAAALATLEAHGLRTAILDAMTAVVDKSSKLT
ncbi:pyrroline-5-carboxylate reductase [Aestuariimicrobium sp. Y1814]|uniref:pyrroline-5-carboxylate reductase n=1 Tax=Aestuariimicrobium sp. Y1814 TaxID=3418742 RepID=UPI003DA6EBB3